VYCPGTLLWSARVSGLTRSTMLKLASKPIYQDMTVRNVNTTTRIFELMQRLEKTDPGAGRHAPQRRGRASRQSQE
jgi:hypothetical protein